MAYELYYWPMIQGRGEYIRLALEDVGAAYDDVARHGNGVLPQRDAVFPECRLTPRQDRTCQNDDGAGYHHQKHARAHRSPHEKGAVGCARGRIDSRTGGED